MKQNTDTLETIETELKDVKFVKPEEEEKNKTGSSSRGRYILTATSKETNILASMYISRQLSFNFGETEKIAKAGVSFYMVGMNKKSLTATTQKAYNMIRQKIADKVAIGSKVEKDIRIFIRADEYLDLAKKDSSNQTLIYNTNKKLKKALEALSCIKFIAKNDKGAEIRIPLEGGIGISDPVNGNFLFTVSADYVNTLNIARYTPRAYFELPEDNPLPCYLYDKLSYHYGQDGNVKRGTRNILGLESLLTYLDGVLPSFLTVCETGGRHYRERIKLPLEKALHSLEEHNLIRWEYVGEDKKPLSDEDKERVCVDESFTYKCFLKFELLDKEEFDRARRGKKLTHKAQEKAEGHISEEEYKKQFENL